MCIIALAIRHHPDWPFVVAANRDERHDRAAEPLAAWRSSIIAGRDAVAGGTWLGVHPEGRFAALTNIRHDGVANPDAPSRGGLVPSFLTNAEAPPSSDLAAYNPFNLMLWNGSRMAALSNRPVPHRATLDQGLHLVGNTIAGEQTSRSSALLSRLERQLTVSVAPRDLLDPLGVESAAVEPDGAIFLKDPDYGTRCSTVVAVDPSAAA